MDRKSVGGQGGARRRSVRSGASRFDAQDLIETIRSVAAGGRSGTLTVRERGGRQCHLYFRDGLVKLVDSGTPEHDSLEDALLGARTFSREEVDAARSDARRSGKSLAQVLLERGAARGVDAVRLMDVRSRREAARLANWKVVGCSFREGQLPHSGAEPYASRLGGGLDAEELIADLRRAAHGGR
jgi:hypothetical protein